MSAETQENWYSQFKSNKGLERTLLSHQPSNEHELAYFVYDLDALAKHLGALQQQDVIKLWYAVKANPLSSIIKTVGQAGVQFDVASSGELNQVLKQGVSADNILNTGPAKSKQQITEFLQKGVNIFVVESLNQLIWLNEAAGELGCCPDVLLRVQLQWPEGEKNPLGGNQVTPFGMSVDAWKVLKQHDLPNVNLKGLHIFQWGNMLSNAKMYSLWQQMVEPLVNLAKDIGMQLQILDLGGGLGIDYLEQQQHLSWQQIVDDLAQIKQQAGVEELWLELGRYAVASCGYYVTEVIDRKSNFSREQVVLAAGINHLLRPAITDQPFPVRLLKGSKARSQQFDLHGPLCTSMDKLGGLFLPDDVNVGDAIIFGYVGAYGFTESMPFFLCHQLPAEYVYQQDSLIEVRPARPADWYLA